MWTPTTALMGVELLVLASDRKMLTTLSQKVLLALSSDG